MPPIVIPMQRLDSSHYDSHSGGSMNFLVRKVLDIIQRSHGFMGTSPPSLGVPTGPPYGGPLPVLAFGWLAAGWLLGFRLDFGSHIRVDFGWIWLDFGWLSAWLGLDLA